MKLTVLGIDDVTFSMPAVRVIVLAMPRVELADNWRDVPLRATLKRWAVPLKVEAPVKVTVPADAVKLPFTERPDDIEKAAVVVTAPVTESVPKFMAPAPEMVLETPLIVSVPVPVVRLPATDKLPVRINGAAVLTEPVIVRLSGEIPKPLMVAPEPVISNVPPDDCVKDPDPVVARLPVKVTLPAEKLTSAAATVR